jgi:hypothetical protein
MMKFFGYSNELKVILLIVPLYCYINEFNIAYIHRNSRELRRNSEHQKAIVEKMPSCLSTPGSNSTQPCYPAELTWSQVKLC